MPAVLYARVEQHFKVLKLGSLYAAHAASELSNMALVLKTLGATSGSMGIRAHLELMAKSRAEVHRNSWQSVLYAELARSNWFCIAGYATLSDA